MSSGEKAVVFNTRERALSTDHNRLQAFIARDRSQLARYRFNDKRENWYNLPGVATPFVGGQSPLAADVFGGLLVQPGSTSLLVSAGEVGCLFPDPGITADDSPYMLIDDPGVQIAGVLVFTANGGGGTRVDLIECQPVSTILESDSRDIFNPSTGLFTPTNVTKVQAFRLQYRITHGTPGAGLPATSVGWLPLAVAIVSTTAASFSDCDFYDVRPLVEDRVAPQPSVTGFDGYHPVQRAEFAVRLNGGAMCVGGFAVSDFNGYVAGGELRRSTPSFGGTRGGTGVGDGDPNFINLDLSENRDTGFALSAHAFVYLVAAFPGTLPRWVRYSQTAVSPFGRVPRGPRGILVASVNGPGQGNGSAQLITTSVFTGAPGVVLTTLVANTAGSEIAVCNAQEKWVQTVDPPTTASSSIAGSVMTINLAAGTDFPANAKMIRVSIICQFHSGIADESRVEVQAKNFAGPYANVGMFHVVTSDNNPHSTAVTFDVPVIGRATFDDTFCDNVTLTLTYQGGVTPIATPLVSVIGWKLGS